MEQALSIARDTTTLVLPLFLIGACFAMLLAIILLLRVNKIASHVQETTFLVKSVIQSSFFNIASFLAGLFEGKKK